MRLGLFCLAAIALLAEACTIPSEEGIVCDEQYPCPGSFVCDNGRCAPLDSELQDAGAADSGTPDAGTR